MQTHLFEHDFVCPECEKRIPDIEMLKIDDVLRKLVREYVEKTIARSEEAFEQGTGVDEEAAQQAAVSEFAAGSVSDSKDRASSGTDPAVSKDVASNSTATADHGTSAKAAEPESGTTPTVAPSAAMADDASATAKGSMPVLSAGPSLSLIHI